MRTPSITINTIGSITHVDNLTVPLTGVFFTTRTILQLTSGFGSRCSLRQLDRLGATFGEVAQARFAKPFDATENSLFDVEHCWSSGIAFRWTNDGEV